MSIKLENMNFFFIKCCLLILISQLFTACNPDISRKHKKNSILKTSNLNYAKNFDYFVEENFIKLVIKTPYQSASSNNEYVLTSSKKNHTSKNHITIPVQKLIATSSTHIPMIELLEATHTLIGFPNTQYISSKNTRQRIKQKKIKEVGKEGNLNTEIILELAPELIVGYAVKRINKEYSTLEKAGIPVILNADWLEESPLGKAEWIKFFGLLFDKKEKADSIFSTIEANYLEAKKLAFTMNIKPTILSGAVMSKDIWSLPAGESFVATFLKDANLNYLWQHSEGKGSLSLSIESVYEKGKNADFWIAPGYFSSKKQMLESNKHYASFKAFKNDNIFTPTLKKGATGGVLYYELATVRPDLVLKDIIKITNPTLLPNHSLVFFEKMK